MGVCAPELAGDTVKHPSGWTISLALTHERHLAMAQVLALPLTRS